MRHSFDAARRHASGVMAAPGLNPGVVPAIHIFLGRASESKTWMLATSAGMTTERLTQFERNAL